ncbi:MAG: glycosyltransferase, partial [Gemmatimonadaceae bacterium]|nr:glycosyltransferase [Gemmatimonadaceae bacterium]
IAVALGRRSIRAPWIVVHHGVTAEGARVRAYHAIDRLASLRADAVVCVSPSQRARFVGARGPVLVIANAALMGTIPELDEIPATPPSLRFVGRLSHEKGADRALRLLAALRGDGTPIAMDVVGDGPSMGELQRLADSLGVAAHVRWHGHVAAPWRGASAHDLLVLPSRSEGMPNALFEATIVGMRHVAADVGDVASMHAAAPAAGVVVPSTDDPHVWREAARRALALPWHADDRRAARDALVAQFGVEARASRFAELYARLLGAPRGEA